MASTLFGVNRRPVFSLSQLEQIQEAMLLILAEVGIRIHQEKIRKLVRQKGFRIEGGRILFDRDMIMSFIDAERSHHGNAYGPSEIEPSPDPLTLDVSPYPQSVHDLDTDKIVPFTSERLIEATKIVDALSEHGVWANVPGCPVDVPPELQPVKQYWIGATYSRSGRYPVDAKSVRTMRYVMEMADVLNHPIRSLPVYVFSPLRLGGESLDCVLEYKDRLHSVGVSDMLSVGCSAPIRVGDACAMASAEVVGSAIIVREITELEVHWGIRICPFDMRGLAMILGSPEDFLFQLACSEVNAFLHGIQWWPAAGYTHTTAKLPGAQASAEKASLMTIGALLGARHFSSGGTLSLDEVFSAEQLVIDCEIKDHVQRLVAGLDVDCDPQSCLQDVLEGIEHGFVGLNTTLDNYKSLYWHPHLFERRFLSPWQGAGCPTIRQQARELIRDLLEKYNYELEPDLQKDLNKIYARAESELGR